MPISLEKPFIVIALLLSTGAVSSVWLLETSVSGLGSTEGDVRGQLLWISIYIVVILLSIRVFPTIIHRLRGARWQLSLVALAVVSVAWSATPEFSLRRAVALIGTTALGAYFGVRYSLPEQLKLVGWMFILAIVFSLAAAVLIPEFAFSMNSTYRDLALMPDYAGAFRGVFDHKNSAGTLMVLGLIVFLQLSRVSSEHRALYAVCAGLSSLIVFLSHSATAIVMVVVCCAIAPVCWALTLPKGRALSILVLWSLPVTWCLGWLLVDFDDAVALLGRDSTLTGRTGLWQFVFSAIAQRPVFGYGYEGFWPIYGGNAKTIVGWVAPHAHNGFLELTINLGFVGLAIFMLGYIVVFRKALRLTKQNLSGAYWPLSFLIFLGFYNITLPGILDRNNFVWIVFVAISISLGSSWDQAETSKPGMSAAC